MDFDFGYDELVIRYNYGRGRMAVDMKHFFPCSNTVLKKLFKVIQLDDNHYLGEFAEHILKYLNCCLAAEEQDKKESGRKYLEQQELFCEYRDRVTNKKHPNGVPLTKDELEEMRKRRDSYKRSAAVYKSRYTRANSNIEKYKKNIELTEQFRL